MRPINNFNEQEFLQYCREQFTYDPETGHLWWKTDGRGKRSTDKPAGSFNGRVRVLHIKGRLYGQARVIVMLLTGLWPHDFKITFRNGDPNDTRKANLQAERIPCRFKKEKANAV